MDVLDGIRGLAAFFVFFSHGSEKGLHLVEGVQFAGLGSGKIGVYLFFVLSAFLLTRLLLFNTNKKLITSGVWKSYALRRILRIYPLYLLAVAVIFSGLSFFPLSPLRIDKLPDLGDAFIAHVLLQGDFHHLWTIPVEIIYYLIIPIVVLIYTHIFKRNLWATIYLLLPLFAANAVYIRLNLPETEFIFLRYAPIFLCGSLAAIVQEHYEKRQWKIPNWIFSLGSNGGMILAFILMPLLYTSYIHSYYPYMNPSLSVFWGILFSVFLLCILNGDNWLNTLFASSVVRFFGIISFSFYLWHPLVLSRVTDLGIESNALSLLVYLLLTTGFSVVTFFIIERPLSKIRLKN